MNVLGVTDITTMDTTPGATGVHASLAPPAEFCGSAEQYRLWLLEQWRDIGVKQHMLSAAMFYARYSDNMQFIGPYADQLRASLVKLRTTA